MADASKAAAESLAEKLEAFAATIPDDERDILAAMMLGGDDAEVSGFGFDSKSASAVYSASQKFDIRAGLSMEVFPKIKLGTVAAPKDGPLPDAN